MISRPALASPNKNNRSPTHQPSGANSPIKYLLQNNVQLNSGTGQRGQEEVFLIGELMKQCRIFKELDLPEQAVEDASRAVVLIFCESPHIMSLKENELYVILEGQGFEYMQNDDNNELSRKYKVYENQQYVMVRKILTNDYFLALNDNSGRYHTRNKYQLMVDQHTLLAKISDDLFHKLFLPKLQERQKKLSAFLKSVHIFNGLPNSFFLEFSKFLEDQTTQPQEKVILRGQKTKFVYFIRKGRVEVHRFNDKNRPAAGSSQYIISGKGFTSQQLTEGDTFGMEDELGEGTDEEVVSVEECQLLRIEKRLLAIIITSFDFEFQQRSKIWSQININSQIRGQNYSSPEQQLLAKNAERIRTGQKKARDLKLRCFANKKATIQQNTDRLSRESSKRETEEMQTSKTLSPEKRRMIKTTDGRFRSTHANKFNNYLAKSGEGKTEMFRNQIIESKRLSHYEPFVHNYEMVALQTEEPKPSPLLRSSKAFDYIQELESYKWNRPVYKSLEKTSISQKLIPKMQMRNKDSRQAVDRYDQNMIGVFLDKKIKNEMVRKAERVININKNLKSIESKNLKRLFSTKEGRTICTLSEADKKSIANDIVERMANLKDNPLLLHVESQRRQMERQMKQTAKKGKVVSSDPQKNYNKEEECILIKNK